jgi:hypothetical protein
MTPASSGSEISQTGVQIIFVNNGMGSAVGRLARTNRSDS